MHFSCMSDTKGSPKVPRTISWTPEIEALAVRLATESGYFPERKNGGVSLFLADLVRTASEAGVVRDTATGYLISLDQRIDERLEHRLEQLQINIKGKVNAGRKKE
jgi:hypothetical protein